MPKKNKQKKAMPKDTPQSTPTLSRWFSSVSLPQEEKKLALWEWTLIYLIFFCIFLLYFFTLAPNVPTGDSGELITSAFTLGISHPPGYPLFNLLGTLFSYLPFGNIAWRINLSSAVFNFLASVFIFLTLFKIIKYWPAAVLGALFFATAPIIWEYSLKAEVFALNNLFAALILYLLVCTRNLFLKHESLALDQESYQNKSSRLLYITLFICGLALTNHQTIVLLAPSVMLCLYYYQRSTLIKPRSVFIALALFIMGLAVLIYIPIRARSHPYLNWDNPETLDAFLSLILRKDYGTLTFMNVHGETYNLLDKYGIYFLSLIKQFTPIGLILALIGIFFIMNQKDKKLGGILLLAYVLSSFLFIALANLIRGDPIYLRVFERFYMLPSVLIALFIGLGIYFLQQRVLGYVTENRKKISSCLINGFIAAVIILAASLNFSKVSQRNSNIDYHLGYNLLNSFEKNALFITYGDIIIHVLLYMQRVENIRTDVTVLDTAMLTYPWHCKQLKQEHPDIKLPCSEYHHNSMDLMQLIALNIETQPIYVNSYFKDANLATNYQVIPMGLVKKVLEKDTPLNKEDYLKKNTTLWESYDLNDIRKIYAPGTDEEMIRSFYTTSYFDLAFQYQELGLLESALYAYNQALGLNDATVPNAYKNAAIIYYNTKHQIKPAVEYFKKYIKLVPHDEDSDMILSFIKEHSKE